MSEPKLYVYGCSSLGIYFLRCKRCKEVTVYGNWDQMKSRCQTVIDRVGKQVKMVRRCDHCGWWKVTRYRLTTGRTQRHRLVSWERVFWWLLPRLPARWVRPAAWATLWLEGHLPI